MAVLRPHDGDLDAVRRYSDTLPHGDEVVLTLREAHFTQRDATAIQIRLDRVLESAHDTAGISIGVDVEAERIEVTGPQAGLDAVRAVMPKDIGMPVDYVVGSRAVPQ